MLFQFQGLPSGAVPMFFIIYSQIYDLQVVADFEIFDIIPLRLLVPSTPETGDITGNGHQS